MFKVIHKETGEIVTVFGISGLMFMLWDEQNGEWRFDSIDNYKPLPDIAEAYKQFAKACELRWRGENGV